MPTKKPRITVTLEPEQWGVLRRVAHLQGRSMGDVIRELIQTVEPALRRAAELGEAAQEATDDQLAALRRAVERADEELAEPMAAALGFVDETFREVDAITAIGRGRDDPRSVITGVKSSDKGKHRAKTGAQQ